MKISFLGAARTVTGSQHLITVDDKTILLDCGLYQGSPRESREKNANFDFDPATLDAVILSHAHTDHCGNLPNLVKQGFTGPIYCIPVTAYLADLLMRDSGKIQEQEAEEAAEEAAAEEAAADAVAGQQRGEAARRDQRHPHNKPDGSEKEGEAFDQNEVDPLYTREEAAAVKQQFLPTFYDTPFEVVPGVTATLINAGHILGSAAVRLDIEEQNGKRHKLWFSGDIGRRNLPLIRDPELPSDVDVMIMECTYGDKLHADPLLAYTELRDVLSRTLKRGGRVIIPAFAVGRTQEIVYNIHQMFERGEIPQVPVFVDSPLAAQASQIFSDHPEYLDDEARRFIREAGSLSALGFDNLTYIESAQESRALNNRDDPMIIISTSGMLESGRILYHLRFAIDDPRNTILLVSYQAPHTLGRALADGENHVRIMGRMYERRAEVCVVSGLSAHAGQEFLIEYAEAVKDQIQQLFLVHGEEEPAAVLQKKLKEKGINKVSYPYPRQIIEI